MTADEKRDAWRVYYATHRQEIIDKNKRARRRDLLAVMRNDMKFIKVNEDGLAVYEEQS
jgi:hypothetical protein